MRYLVESKQTETNSIIYEFIRNKDGSKTVNTIENFKPYFFVDEKCPLDGWEEIISVVSGFKSIYDTPLKKVSVQKSILVKPTREKIEQLGYTCWEADIPFHNRYTMDTNMEDDMAKLKMCWLDIETSHDEDKKLDIEKLDKEITCMSTKIDGVMTTWLLGSVNMDGVRCFHNEADMLQDFVNYIAAESPDIISAWNIDRFDLFYILGRCALYEINTNRLSPIGDVFIKEFMSDRNIIIKGMVVLDLYEAYKLWRKYGNMPILEKYSLDFVAETVLGKKKIEHKESLTYLWRNDPKRLIEYNRWDVELLELIDNRCKIVDFFDNLRKKCKCQFADVYKTTKLIDGFLISRLNKSVILPTAKKVAEEKYDGAFVFEPKPGIYDNVLCLDIASMYPSIIKTFNISIEVYGIKDIELPTGHFFSKKPGIIPMFLGELATERKEYKRLYKMAKKANNEAEMELWYQRQFGTKILANSLYGYLGYSGSRLYKKEVASAITGMGKIIIQEIIKAIQDNSDCKVIYSDTDSVYIKSTKTNKYQIVLEGIKLRKFINEVIEKLVLNITDRCEIKIEFEKALSKILFTAAKKRYAYFVLWEPPSEGSYGGFVDKPILKVQGFGQKRSDNSKLSKLAQKLVMEMVMNNSSKNDVMDKLREMDKKMRNRAYEDNVIGFPKGIKKELEDYNPPGPVIKGASFSNMYLGTDFGKGSKPKFVWVKDVIKLPNSFTMQVLNKDGIFINKTYKVEAIVFDEKIPEGFVIDWNRMSDSTFRATLETIFEAVGWAWEPLNNTNLFLFGGAK